jgi:hypothetical protein
MAITEFNGVTVQTGSWVYDGCVNMGVCIIARNFEPDFEPDEEGEPVVVSPGPDNVLYYLAKLGEPSHSHVHILSGAFETPEALKDWIEAQPWAPVEWIGLPHKPWLYT